MLPKKGYLTTYNTGWMSDLDKRRRELGMSRAVVAKLSSVSRPTVTRIMKNLEIAPNIPVVRAIAVVLQMEIKVADEITAVSRIDADQYRLQRATEKATRLVNRVQGSMGLEEQAVDATTLDKMIQRTIHELMAGSKRKLWED